MKSIIPIITLLILFSAISFAKTQEEAAAPITLDEATKKITEDTQNKVLNAETKTVENKEIHIIKILTEKGRIQHIQIDAETGENLDNVDKEKRKDP
ncbi:MAG: hypothetical protein Q9M50_11975 [Methylococcales bacterium]|nr:hypothetical protein [Methylococcales bacterium]